MRTVLKSIPLLTILIGFASCKNSMESDITPEISVDNLKNAVIQLAHDSLEGRGAGYPGDLRAARYIASEFKKLGMDPIISGDGENENLYFQKFEFHTLESPNPWEVLSSQNIVGLISGTSYPNEYIIVGGHFDGQGKIGQADLGRGISEGIPTDANAAETDSIWNSAVDNAVSIASILELARVMQHDSLRPERSIIFVAFSAEESGLNGSTYFANHPPVPKEAIKAMVNLEKIVGDPDAEFLYVSYDTNPVFEEVRKKVDRLDSIAMTPFYPGLIANTDHYAFAQRQIPAITIGTGSQINVHTALDHADRLDYELLAQRTEYILRYILELAKSDSPFQFSGNLTGLYGLSGGPATTQEKEERGFYGDMAFKVTAVVSGSEGWETGLRPGDLIISVNDKPVPPQSFYQGLEDVLGEGLGDSLIHLEILRNNQELKLQLNDRSLLSE